MRAVKGLGNLSSAAALTACVVVVAACSGSHPTSAKSTASLGQTMLTSQLQFRSLRALPQPCSGSQPRLSSRPDPRVAATAPDGAGTKCFELTPAIAVVDRVSSIAVVRPTVSGTPWALAIGLMPTQHTEITDYTTAHNSGGPQTGNQVPPADYLATVVDGYVVDAEVVEAQISGDIVQIFVQGGQPSATALLKTLTGR